MNMTHNEKQSSDRSKKQEYVTPVLKRYESPKLCKHKLYKDITLAPTQPMPGPSPPGPPGPTPSPSDPPEHPSYPDHLFPGAE